MQKLSTLEENNVNALMKEAVSSFKAGETETAVNILEDILSKYPSHAEALSTCGMAQSLLGNHSKAVELYKRAITSHPEDIRPLSSLGHAYIALSDFEKAFGAFNTAYARDKKNSETTYWLGFIQCQKGEYASAETFLRETLALSPSNKEAYLQLSDVLSLQGKTGEAFDVLSVACDIFPQDHDLVYLRGRFAAKTVPGWHLPMLDDQARNDAYEAAIIAKIKPDDIVLDIGTGSGLLAMMAARAGAKHVYACEGNAILAHLAEQVIAQNGLSDKITVIAKFSSDIVIGKDMPCKADLLVTEIFDSSVVGEGVLSTLNHAWDHLLENDARVIPESANLYGVLTQCPHLQRFHNVHEVNGFDLSPMNAVAQPFSQKDGQIYFETSTECKVLSESFTLQNFDFETRPDVVFETQSLAEASEDGTVDSLLMWFDLTLAPGIVFSTEHSKSQHHWRPASQMLAQTTSVAKGDKVALNTRYTGYFDILTTNVTSS